MQLLQVAIDGLGEMRRGRCPGELPRADNLGGRYPGGISGGDNIPGGVILSSSYSYRLATVTGEMMSGIQPQTLCQRDHTVLPLSRLQMCPCTYGIHRYLCLHYISCPLVRLDI